MKENACKSTEGIMLQYSLIIPHFNDAERLKRLFKTIPFERSDIEVIVIDDCSPDQSKLAAMKTRWQSAIWQTTRKNSGAGAARNVGLAHAKGKYLVFADSDDEFLPNAFDSFDSQLSQQNELTYFLAVAVQEVENLTSNRADRINDLCNQYLETPSSSRLNELRIGHVVPWAKIYSRSFITGLGLKFDETRVGNDIAFNVIAAFHAKQINVVPVFVYRVYRRAQSLTADSSPSAFIERVNVQAQLANKLKNINVETRPSGTGWMLASFAYGLPTVLSVWRICLCSNLKIEFLRILKISRWKQFIRSWNLERKEKKDAK